MKAKSIWWKNAVLLALPGALFSPAATVAAPFYLEAPEFPSARAPLTVSLSERAPVLRTSEAGQWDSVDLLNPSVVFWRGQYWNYYSGFDGKAWRTGVATSADGIAWKKYEHNPVLSPGAADWDREFIAANGSAIVISDHLNYYFQGNGTEHTTEIGLATSSDGLTFRIHPAPVLLPGSAGAWDETTVSDPYVISYNGSFYMYFLGANRAGIQRLGVAKSDDGIHWSKHPGNPILDIGASGDFDSRGLGEPSVVNLGNMFLMLYTGRNDLEQRGIGAAVSLDGINWRRQSPQSLSIPRDNWNSEVQCDSTLLTSTDGRTLRVWYGGGNRREPASNLNGQVGYAELALPEWASSGFDVKSNWAASAFSSTEILKGSYPIEPDGTCWIGREATIFLKPPFGHGVQVAGYVPVSMHRKGDTSLKQVTVQFFVNNQKEKQAVFMEDNAFDINIPVPPDAQEKVARLTVRVSSVVNPAKAKLGADMRDLGIIINRISVPD